MTEPIQFTTDDNLLGTGFLGKLQQLAQQAADGCNVHVSGAGHSYAPGAGHKIDVPQPPEPPELGFWGKVTAVSGADHTVVEQSQTGAATFTALTGGRSVTAQEVNFSGGLGSPAQIGDIVWVYLAFDTGGTARYNLYFQRNMFPVTVRVASGSAGDASSTCGFVYNVKDMRGNSIGLGVTPLVTRMPNCTYKTPDSDSYGMGFFVGSTFKLAMVFQEVPLTAQIDLVTQVGYNTTTKKLYYSKATITVLAYGSITDVDVLTGATFACV